jgi:hypothetical protein
VVEHPRLVEKHLREREGAAGIAGEQRARGERRRGVDVNHRSTLTTLAARR